MRLPLLDGQGNFGSVDGDPPAAQRYTEVRLEKVAMQLLEDLDKDTVDFRPNYDEKELEPIVLPARFPNLLVNGAGGIAVGMATNIPPHNLGETIDGVLAVMDRPDISFEDLIEIIPGPDFPTGGSILGRAGIRSAYATGRGSIVMRSKVDGRRDPQGPRSADRHRNSLSGEQGDADREDRRTRARETRRGHFGPARRIRSRRHAHRHRDQARRRAGRGAEPALALHRDAIELRRQHDRAERRSSGDDDAEGHAGRLHRIPRRSRHPAHQTSAHQGARRRPCAGRPRHRGRQYRRSDPPDPHLSRRRRGAQRLDGARLAGARHGAAGRADRRSAPRIGGGWHDPSVRSAGARHSRTAARPPDRARPRRNRRGAEQARRRDRRIP